MGLVCISFTSLAGGWFLLENCASLTAVCVWMQGATVNFALESHNFGVMLTRTLRQNIRWRWKPFNLNSSFFWSFTRVADTNSIKDYFLRGRVLARPTLCCRLDGEAHVQDVISDEWWQFNLNFSACQVSLLLHYDQSITRESFRRSQMCVSWSLLIWLWMAMSLQCQPFGAAHGGWWYWWTAFGLWGQGMTVPWRSHWWRVPAEKLQGSTMQVAGQPLYIQTLSYSPAWVLAVRSCRRKWLLLDRIFLGLSLKIGCPQISRLIFDILAIKTSHLGGIRHSWMLQIW